MSGQEGTTREPREVLGARRTAHGRGDCSPRNSLEVGRQKIPRYETHLSNDLPPTWCQLLLSTIPQQCHQIMIPSVTSELVRSEPSSANHLPMTRPTSWGPSSQHLEDTSYPSHNRPPGKKSTARSPAQCLTSAGLSLPWVYFLGSLIKREVCAYL